MVYKSGGLKISNANIEVSKAFDEVTVNDTPLVRFDTRKKPGTPPSACEVKNIREVEAIWVLATVTVPPTSVAVPCKASEPVPSATCKPRPAVRTRKLPVLSKAPTSLMPLLLKNTGPAWH